MSFKKFCEIYREVQTTEGKDIVSPLSFFDASIKPSTPEHNKNFVNKKLEIITKKTYQRIDDKNYTVFWKFFPVSFLILPSSRKTSILQYHCILYFAYISFSFLPSCNLGEKE